MTGDLTLNGGDLKFDKDGECTIDVRDATSLRILTSTSDANYFKIANGSSEKFKVTGTGKISAGTSGSPFVASEDYHVATKKYVDTALSGQSSGVYLPLAGGTMTGQLNMGGKTLTSPLNPTSDNHVGSRVYNDGRYLKLSGGTMSGSVDMDSNEIDMNGGTITRPKNPTSDNHVGSRIYNDLRYLQPSDGDGRYLKLSGGTMVGSVDMGNQFLLATKDPTSSAHVGDRGYNDGRYWQEVTSSNVIKGINYKGQSCVTSDATPSTSEFTQVGQLVWSSSSKTLFVRG